MKLALVTGSSRGIGAAIAKAYGKREDTVVLVHCRQDIEGATSTVEAILAAGGQARAYTADVADPEGVRDLAKAIRRDFPGHELSTLVNNAGAILRPGDWLESSDELVRRTVEVNLLSVIWTIREFAPGMVAAGRGHIVNLCTTYAINGAAAVLAYTAAKAGVRSVTTAMASELGAKGVRVNAIAPGNVDTQMTRSAGEGVIAWTLDTTPLGRLGHPDEIAQAAIYLEDAAFVTGEVLLVDGGQILKI